MSEVKVGDKVISLWTEGEFIKDHMYIIQEGDKYLCKFCVSSGNHTICFNKPPDQFKLVKSKPDLSNPDRIPFGELDEETQKSLLIAWIDGEKLQYCYGGDKWHTMTKHPLRNDTHFYHDHCYRVKPKEDPKKVALEEKIKAHEECIKELREEINKHYK